MLTTKYLFLWVKINVERDLISLSSYRSIHLSGSCFCLLILHSLFKFRFCRGSSVFLASFIAMPCSSSYIFINCNIYSNSIVYFGDDEFVEIFYYSDLDLRFFSHWVSEARCAAAVKLPSINLQHASCNEGRDIIMAKYLLVFLGDLLGLGEIGKEQYGVCSMQRIGWNWLFKVWADEWYDLSGDFGQKSVSWTVITANFVQKTFDRVQKQSIHSLRK